MLHPVHRRLLLATALLLLCPAIAAAQRVAINDVRSFIIQTDGMTGFGSFDRLATGPYDLIVTESSTYARGFEWVDMKGIVARMHAAGPKKLILAYLDVGAAESSRSYWRRWKAPKPDGTKGNPDFILAPNPPGVSDSYPVAYWDQRWQNALVNNPDSALKGIMAAGFDGLYLDWVHAYCHPPVAAEAKRLNIDPAKAMVDFLSLIRRETRKINPNAVIIAQSAPYLLDLDERFLNTVDAVAFAGTWFWGKADNLSWKDPAGGDIPNPNPADSPYSTQRLLKQYAKYITAGKPVLSVDCCLKQENATAVYTAARANKLIPLVTRNSFSDLPTPPPPSP